MSVAVLDTAIASAHEELAGIRQIKKCASCECLLDVLDAMRADLAGVDSAVAETARADFQAWSEAGAPKRHRCPGCEPCLPNAPYNQFNAALAGEGVIAAGRAEAGGCAGGSCSCGSSGGSSCDEADVASAEPAPVDTASLAAEAPADWPALEGNYIVGDPNSPVAICTLADDDLMRELAASGVTSRVAITGTLATENLGVERLTRNLVANPRIQTLILCGRDSRGHHAGQALLALKQSGIDAQRRIVGALGSRAMLKNLEDAEIAAFRARITLVDEIGAQDVDHLSDIISACLRQDKPAPDPQLITLTPRRLTEPKLVEARAQERREWVHDPEGFFLILLDRRSGAIVCEHYAKDGAHDETLRGTHAADIANTAIRRGLLSRLDHAAYLGRELAKAEAALTHDLTYTQDAPLSEP